MMIDVKALWHKIPTFYLLLAAPLLLVIGAALSLGVPPAWFLGTYQFWRDFAGPLATTFAAAIVARISYRFGKVQADIAQQQASTARQQRNIALDNLRYKFFDKRYAIYDSAKQLVRLALNEAPRPDFEAAKISPLYLALDEAPFVFPPKTCELLRDLRGECERYVSDTIKRREPGYVYSKPDTEAYYARGSKLANALQNMPQHFGDVLSFPQLIQATSPRK